MTAWPPALAGTPAAAVLSRAIEGRRLAHSLLLHGGDPELLAGAAHAMAEQLLGSGGRAGLGEGGGHPDCFVLRPAGKMRQISAEATRDLIGKVQVSPTVAPCKVAILHEVDRMNLSAANIFLKTLEEPPARTVLILLTTRPYALLPTIRSRCFHFRLAAGDAKADAAEPSAGWSAWFDDYRAWIGRLAAGKPDKSTAAAHILTVYGLVTRFGAILRTAVEQSWDTRKEGLPAELDEEEKVAIETGLANGLRARFLSRVAEATRAYARELPPGNDTAVRQSFPAAIARLEHDASLLRFNLNESAALEDFLLASLRIWSRK